MKIKILILIIISLFSSWNFFRPGYPSMQDDIQVFRLQQFDQCLRDGQIPCRYIADGGYGYGYPLYNFYSPLPYAVSEFLHLLGFSFVDSIKIAFIIPSFLKTFGMYFLATAFFGSTGAFLATTLYTFAPYIAVNSVVRGAIGESWALALLPFVFWSLYRQRGRLSVVFLSLLFLSHNLTLIYAIPLLLLFSFLTKKSKHFLRTLLWSTAISAFFLIPAFFEKNLTTVDTMTQGYFNYIIHFSTLKELFLSSFWGYSASMWGPIDGLSFNIGLYQYVIPTLIFVCFLFNKNLKHRSLVIIFFLIGILALFLTHNKSTFIWQLFPFMPYFQFPWRFLGLAVFTFSFIGGGLAILLKNKLKIFLTTGLIISIVFLNTPYFISDLWYPKETDANKLNGPELVRQSAAGLMDYWPKYSKKFPDTYAPQSPIIASGQATINSYYKKSNSSETNLSVLTPNAVVNFPVVYFPNWELVVDGQKTDFKIEPELGLIQTDLNQGNHQISLKFKDTPLRTFANLFSLISLGAFIILIIREKRL